MLNVVDVEDITKFIELNWCIKLDLRKAYFWEQIIGLQFRRRNVKTLIKLLFSPVSDICETAINKCFLYKESYPPETELPPITRPCRVRNFRVHEYEYSHLITPINSYLEPQTTVAKTIKKYFAAKSLQLSKIREIRLVEYGDGIAVHIRSIGQESIFFLMEPEGNAPFGLKESIVVNRPLPSQKFEEAIKSINIKTL